MEFVPHAPSKSPIPLLLLGLLSSAAALAGVWGIGQLTEDFNLMSLWIMWIIPAGALLVGVAAGSGYGLGSWWTGVRISNRLLLAVVLLQTTAYFLAQYLEYLHLVSRMGAESEDPGFWTFFDWTTRQIRFKSENDSGYGEPMGAWGYAFRVLEIGGFVLGGLVVPWALKSKPFCDGCQVFMRSSILVLLPASAPMPKLKRKDTEGRQAWAERDQAAREAGLAMLDKVWKAVENRQPEIIKNLLAEYGSGSKEIGKLPSRLVLTLSACPNCRKGRLSAASLTGQGNELRRQELGAVELSDEMTLALIA